MAKSKQTSRPSEQLFADEQKDLFEKTYEEQLEKQACQPVECLGMTFPNDEARRVYFLEKLREQLKDPKFRKIEGFPIGEDEDILALSDPPYYTACPNPFLSDYVNWWKCKNSPPSRVSPKISPYTADIIATMRDPILNLHAYHTKVPPKALASLILNYTKPGDLILDAYAGSGMLALGADLCAVPPNNSNNQEDLDPACYGPRGCIMVDLSTLATHIAGAHVRALPIEFPALALAVIQKAEADNKWLYEHTVELDNQASGKGVLSFAVWTEYFICKYCGTELEAWENQVDLEHRSIRKNIRCEDCDAELDTTRLKRATHREYDPFVRQIRTTTKKTIRWLVQSTSGTRRERKAGEADLASTRRVMDSAIDLDIPVDELPYMHMSHERNDLPSLGYQYVHSFFAPRTLYAISDLLKRFSEASVTPTSQRWFTYLLTSVLDSHLVLRNRYLIDRHHPSGTSCGPLSGTLYVPTLQCEVNVYGAIRKKLKKLGTLTNQLSRERGFVSTQAAQSLALPKGCIDYIFIDPPFGANINYSDLNYISESWLKVWTNRPPEAVIDRVQNKGTREYGKLMSDGLNRCFSALRPGGWLTILFHNSKNAVWNTIQEAIERAGFVVADVRIMDKGGTTIFQDSQAVAVKKDLLISAYKPEEVGTKPDRGASGKLSEPWAFIRLHLEKLPNWIREGDELVVVREREPHLLYDRMVAFYVNRGMPVPLSAAEFYEGLSERLSERDGMYFLPEQAAEYDRKRMSAKEVRQLVLFICDEASAIQWLKQQLTHKPQTFQDIHPQFLKEIGGWQKHEKALELSELLEQNFIRYTGKDGVPSQIHGYLSSNFKALRNLPKDDPALMDKAKDHWYVPDPNKAGDLEKLRERMLMREFEEYRESKQKRLKVFRLEAMRAGFKKAWQEREYATIIEVARKIPETVLQEDSKLLMWYDQAVTRAGDHGA